jgi:hypothetical protein
MDWSPGDIGVCHRPKLQKLYFHIIAVRRLPYQKYSYTGKFHGGYFWLLEINLIFAIWWRILSWQDFPVLC